MINRATMTPLASAVAVTIIGVIGVGVIGMRPGCPPILPAVSWLVAMTALPSTVTYLLTRRDFGARRAAPAAAACVIVMGVGTWLGFVFAFVVFFAAAALYLVLRRSVRVGVALAVSMAALMGGLVASALVMARALDGMG